MNNLSEHIILYIRRLIINRHIHRNNINYENVIRHVYSIIYWIQSDIRTNLKKYG